MAALGTPQGTRYTFPTMALSLSPLICTAPHLISDMPSNCPHLALREAHGGMGAESTHKPFLISRASFSIFSSSLSPGAYFLYHQHQSYMTNV